ncbi:unnamed protein product [Paramecium primaurelia]|uniref:F5/8 type C domain-containing protein n=1 Tax=Paramecium primaurelia TaxID=5886 RepID=A0A8S1KRI0_PARPR|nr:unnamed protein product [Paramecium primaurelia]CAD8058061.1 unnamed protein product [Paramecium primaurelia]
MSSKLLKLLTMLLIFNMPVISNQKCLTRQTKIKSIIRGNYQNVLHLYKGALISSRITNGFLGGNNGCCLRDSIYTLSTYTWSPTGQSITLDLLQKYELNTLKIWFWDGDNRFYRIRIYIIFENSETQIYDNFAQSVFTIKFSDQMVKGFRILSVAGNTYNPYLHFIKVEAYYQLQMNI